jgi:DNA-binding SARP family transcriptional activator
MDFLLGPLEMGEGGRSLPLGGPRQRALLALLLLRGGGSPVAARRRSPAGLDGR